MAHAKKRFGQHFLEPAWVDKLLHVIEPTSGDVFLEIGPGRGALTRPLADRAGAVAAIEIDRDLAAALRVSPPPRFPLLEGDFLEISAAEIRAAVAQATELAVRGIGASGPGLPRALRVAGNLPYNVASPILFKLVALYAAGLPLLDATVMLQREVADRLVAQPGSKTYGVLSVLIQHQARAERVLALPPGAFRPAPKVHSAVVRLQFHSPEPAPVSHAAFVALTHAVFTRRRKTLANALRAFEPSARLSPTDALGQTGIDGRRRPETLSVAELVRISDAFSRAML
jgi:16S rRNA (adenine1518-N6/adenine1519-N6)-dimethyltransferase